MLEGLIIVAAAALVVWLYLWMRVQQPETNVQKLIQQKRYKDAAREAERMLARHPDDAPTHLARADALKLDGSLDEAIASYRNALRLQPDDAAAAEGLALALTWAGREPAEARALMEHAMRERPEIQEFQSLALAFILLEQGQREEALRIFRDNLELLQTRFEMDYTDPDPLLAETLYLFARLSDAAGDTTAAEALYARAAAWAPGSLFASKLPKAAGRFAP